MLLCVNVFSNQPCDQSALLVAKIAAEALKAFELFIREEDRDAMITIVWHRINLARWVLETVAEVHRNTHKSS
jgi:hypothetical protein